MAQLDFYATSEDIAELIDYMFTLAPMRLFEAYSQVDHEIREFKSSTDFLNSGHIEQNHNSILLGGWWSTVTNNTSIERFTLKPKYDNFRYQLNGIGTFQISQRYTINKSGECLLGISHISHWNEKGAVQIARSCAAAKELDVNWKEFRKLSGKLHRQVRTKLPKAKLFNKVPILEGALNHLKHGGVLTDQPEDYHINSKEIVI